jgi:hypothetical protein
VLLTGADKKGGSVSNYRNTLAHLLLLAFAGAALGGSAFLPGCASNSNSQPDATTRAQADPMHYSPDMSDTDINNSKDINKDVDHVLNP